MVRTQRHIILKQIFNFNKINKNKLNEQASSDFLDQNIRELSQQILEKESNHGILDKKVINYRPQRTDKSDLICEPDIAIESQDYENMNYRGVSRNSHFGW